MKTLIRIAFIAIMVVVAQGAFAQKQYKFGHIDSNKLLQSMPERAKAQTEMENFAKQLEDNALSLQTEFEKKYNEYVASADSLSPLIRQDKEAELQGMQQRIQTFNAQAQKELQNKESLLLQPIIEKARKAIKEVSEEGGYTYVFDISTGAVLHFSDDSEDITAKVKVKLGIQ